MLANTLWVEKYRPRSLEDLVLPSEYREDFKRFLFKQEIPNLLFSGPPGGGKTTTARIFASKSGLLQFPSDNLLSINGSSKETRGISYVQDVVESFLKIPPAGSDPYKIVFIDEGDFLTDAAYNSLRGVIEKYSRTSRFLMTCNYLTKVPDAIQSRFTHYTFKQVPLEFVLEHCQKVLESENVAYEENDIKFLVEGLYPDIRKIVNALQKCSNERLIVNSDIVRTKEKDIVTTIIEIMENISNGSLNKIQRHLPVLAELASSPDLDFRSVYEKLFYTRGLSAPCKISVNHYANTHGSCLIPSMHFMAMVFEMIRSAKELYEMKQK